jgi:hypothetical protein
MPLNSTARRAGAAAFALLTGMTALPSASATEPTTQPEAADTVAPVEGSAQPAAVTPSQQNRRRRQEEDVKARNVRDRR